MAIILKVLGSRFLTLLINESRDFNKGITNDYVKQQYIGNVGKTENGIVVVTASGWTNFRMTHYEQIEKGRKLVMNAFLTAS